MKDKARLFLNNQLIIIGAIALISLIFRVYTAAPVESGGDALYKWWELRKYSELNMAFPETVWSHHMMRWVINLPVYFIQNSVSKNPAFIYLFPIVYSTISSVLCYCITFQITKKKIAGIAAALIFILLPQNISAGAQFLPMGPAVMYLLLALFSALRYLDSGKIWWTALTALFWFCSWGAKVTMLIYIPAFVLFFFLVSWFRMNGAGKRSLVEKCKTLFLPAAVFLCVCVVLMIIEAAVFTEITGVEGGRVGNLTHGVHSPTYEKRHRLATVDFPEYIVSPVQIFDNVYPEASANVLLGAALICAVLYLLQFPLKKSAQYLLLIILLLTGFFGHAYSATTFFPFSRPERFLPRYFLDIYTFSLLFSICAVSLFIKKDQGEAKPAGIIAAFCWIALTIMVSCFFDLTKSYQSFFQHLKEGSNIIKVSDNRDAVQYANDNFIPIVSLSALPEEEPRWQDFCKFYVLYSPVSRDEFADRAIVHSKMKSFITLNDGRQYHVLFTTNKSPERSDKFLFLDFDKRYYFINSDGKRISML